MIKRVMDRMPAIKTVMTPFPHAIGSDETLADAKAMMTLHGIHHLPVVDAGRPIGVLSRSAMDRLEEGGRDAAGLITRDAPLTPAFVVDLAEPLDRVLFHMAQNRLEVALVLKAGRLAGIFTASDVCRSFGEFLRAIFPEGGRDSAA